ncbi:MAG: hypothetical protein ACYCS7_14100 [Acidimicrobiales bacterium]
MAMREECKHFQSRTYTDGETARFCVLDLAPEAPWRCPADCAAYEKRMADVGWVHGNLVEKALEDEPDLPGGEIADLLDRAEDIVNAVGVETVEGVDREDRQAARKADRASGPWWKRFRSR